MSKPAVNRVQPAPGPDEQQRKKRKPTGRLECKLGLLLGLGGLLGSRLGQLWIAFDVFSQFTLQFGVITLAFAIGLLMPRAKLLAAFLVIIAGVVGIGVWPHVAARVALPPAEARAGTREFDVVTFNTWYDNQQVEAVEAEIQRLDADIVALMEVGPNKKPMLERLAQRYPYQANCFTIDFCNLVILSKVPIQASEAKVNWAGPAYLLAKLGPEAGGLTVMAVHTIRFPHSLAQFRQVTALAAMVEAMPGRKLVMGDFNATPFSRIIATMQANSGLTRLSSLPTWPSRASLPQIAIDHVFVSPAIGMTGGQRIGEAAGSDHYPVGLRIAVPVAP